MSPSRLFEPLALRGLTLASRIAVSPMCQYSAADGSAQPWHLQHLGGLSLSGAGLVTLEATAVERRGRISHGCLGLYSDGNESALHGVIAACRPFATAAFGIQLGHAGRKGSAQRPWQGGGPLGADQEPWATVAPSAIPALDGWPVPEALDAAGIAEVTTAFVAAAERAARIGFDLIELHGAHGYLVHQFLSPLANRRDDGYGGSPAARMRLPLEIATAVRAVWPADRPLGFRITGTDWLDGGFGIEDAMALAGALKEIGLDYVCVSSGGIGTPRIPVGPGYQVELAARVRAATGIVTQAVGMILEPHQAEAIVATGKADFVAIARGFLDDPRWGWHAAAALGAGIAYPPQYERSRPTLWPGYAAVHARAAG